MKIETKYDIGQQVFIVEYDTNCTSVYREDVREIVISKITHSEDAVISYAFESKMRDECDVFATFEDAENEVNGK